MGCPRRRSDGPGFGVETTKDLDTGTRSISWRDMDRVVRVKILPRLSYKGNSYKHSYLFHYVSFEPYQGTYVIRESFMTISGHNTFVYIYIFLLTMSNTSRLYCV